VLHLCVQKAIKYVKNLLGITSHGELCCLAMRTETAGKVCLNTVCIYFTFKLLHLSWKIFDTISSGCAVGSSRKAISGSCSNYIKLCLLASESK
jgi:hypothetical protein